MEHYNDPIVEDLAEHYGETFARIYCLTMAYSSLVRYSEIQLSEETSKHIAQWYLDRANEFHNCDYVFGVMDLKHDIKEKLKECE